MYNICLQCHCHVGRERQLEKWQISSQSGQPGQKEHYGKQFKRAADNAIASTINGLPINCILSITCRYVRLRHGTQTACIYTMETCVVLLSRTVPLYICRQLSVARIHCISFVVFDTNNIQVVAMHWLHWLPCLAFVAHLKSLICVPR